MYAHALEGSLVWGGICNTNPGIVPSIPFLLRTYLVPSHPGCDPSGDTPCRRMYVPEARSRLGAREQTAAAAIRSGPYEGNGGCVGVHTAYMQV